MFLLFFKTISLLDQKRCCRLSFKLKFNLKLVWLKTSYVLKTHILKPLHTLLQYHSVNSQFFNFASTFIDAATHLARILVVAASALRKITINNSLNPLWQHLVRTGNAALAIWSIFFSHSKQFNCLVR